MDRPEKPESAEPVVTDAAVSPGHDGHAVLVVRVRFENGATDAVTLDADRANRVFEACGAHSPEDLRGQPWRKLLTALQA